LWLKFHPSHDVNVKYLSAHALEHAVYVNYVGLHFSLWVYWYADLG